MLISIITSWLLSNITHYYLVITQLEGKVLPQILPADTNKTASTVQPQFSLTGEVSYWI